MAIVFIPVILTNRPFVIVDDDSIHRMLKTKPWEVSVFRIEAFTKQYLISRFEWNNDTFSKREALLKTLTDEAVFKKLKASISSFQSLAQNQKAKCFFTFEGFGFSNSEKKIVAHISRVLRIGTMAAATPLIVRLTYRESSVSPENPYGLQVVGVEEFEETANEGH
ncbi:MAG: hypothetical protein KA715_09260 [Xanthomonadaceae bacterium]|nr:hypothetical protein [Xanthomonadaceae bacterium]